MLFQHVKGSRQVGANEEWTEIDLFVLLGGCHPAYVELRWDAHRGKWVVACVSRMFA